MDYPGFLSCNDCNVVQRVSDPLAHQEWVSVHGLHHRQRGETFSYVVVGPLKPPKFEDIGGGFRRVVYEEDEE
jgi:hypothetical protein